MAAPLSQAINVVHVNVGVLEAVWSGGRGWGTVVEVGCGRVGEGDLEIRAEGDIRKIGDCL